MTLLPAWLRRRGRIRPYPPVSGRLSVTRGDEPEVYVITTRAGAFTLDLSRVPEQSRAWFLTTAPGSPWPDGTLVWVSRHGQWHACWDLRGGPRFASFSPAEACQMFTAAAP